MIATNNQHVSITNQELNNENVKYNLKLSFDQLEK